MAALWQLSLVSRSPSSHAAIAIDLGAKAAYFTPTNDEATVHVLVPDDTDVDSFCEAISDAAETSLLSHSDGEELYEAHDWETEDGEPLAFRPQLIGRDLWVAPVLCELRPPSNAKHLRLLDSRDGNVFLATYENTLHASTLMLLSLLRVHRDELTGRVLDFGCGSGVLALGALLLGRGPNLHAQATDVVEAALMCARRNAQLNDVDNERFGTYMPWELPSLRAANGRQLVDVALANMLPGPLTSVSSELIGRVRPGGLLLLSGFRPCDLGPVNNAFGTHFEMPDEPTSRRDGYCALACRRNAVPLRTDDLSESAVA